ncbi:MAG: class I SAM-dependent methyltransferase [Myxococcota bacterium]
MSNENNPKVHVPKFGDRHAWRDAAAVVSDEDGNVEIMGNPVMESWQRPYMKELASIATSNGGVVLELGFGLGIASSFIQAAPNVTEHIIVEANADIFLQTLQFARTAQRRTIPIFGFWEEVTTLLRDESIDGILYDTYPIAQGYLHSHQFMFAEHAHRILKPGGVMTYCNLSSWGRLKADYPDDRELFGQTQAPRLKALGFTEVDMKVFSVSPVVDPRFNKYAYPTIPAPIIRK